MSQITNVILHMGTNTQEKAKEHLTQVNHFFNDDTGSRIKPRFAYVNDWQATFYGQRILEVDLAIGAFNYLDLNALVKHLRTVDWNEPGAIQLMVREQNEIGFRIIEVFPERHK